MHMQKQSPLVFDLTQHRSPANHQPPKVHNPGEVKLDPVPAPELSAPDAQRLALGTGIHFGVELLPRL